MAFLAIQTLHPGTLTPAANETAVSSRHLLILIRACQCERELQRTQLHRGAAMESHIQPWGQDPVFDPGSSLFDSSLVGRESVYYDLNSELNPLGAPNMWLSDGVSPDGDVSLVIDNNVGADRANALWRAVDEGRFLDRATTGLTASVLTFNVEYEVFGYVETRYSWKADGSIHVEAVTPVGVPSLVPVVALSLQALAVLYFIVYAARLGTSRALTSRATKGIQRIRSPGHAPPSLGTRMPCIKRERLRHQ